jgi:hypothetical protein
MAVPWVQAYGDAIHTVFGSGADQQREEQVANLQGTKATMVDLQGALRGPMYSASVQSDEVIGQVTQKNIQHLQMQSETGYSIGNHTNATMADATSTLIVTDGATA